VNNKSSIQDALKNFANLDLKESALEIFSLLGYKTNKQVSIGLDFNYFESRAQNIGLSLKAEKCLSSHWEKIFILFQFTPADSQAKNLNLQDTSQVINSFLFATLDLKDQNYTRTQLAQITRELNKPLQAPLIILFRYGKKATLSVIHRRKSLAKRNNGLHVLEKVTLVHEISLQDPHRAHIEILNELSLENLEKNKSGKKITSFEELYLAWQEVLSTQNLNKKFYSDIYTWYEWAKQKVQFPNLKIQAKTHETEKYYKEKQEEENYTSVSLIRLLTRIIFVWFLKEKGLLPKSLFLEEEIKQILKNYTKEDSTYYRAILQNLFFATLNANMDSRSFVISSNNKKENQKHFGIKNLFRYEDCFKIPSEEVIKLFSNIPFLNGGLFDCLDFEITEESSGKKYYIYLDGFSREESRAASVPNYLFFGDGSNKGLIQILQDYKFTIEENTPIQEDVALDPELLGNVFENLLASYNPETQATARNQTGSFYTPREIVNYMVEESLFYYFQTYFQNNEINFLDNLLTLLDYGNETNPFDSWQTLQFLEAIEKVKVLDPACGSGAFPMGILHKLVFLLQKLDPQNKIWKQKILSKVPPEIREETEKSLQTKTLDYSRKLGLIENCIYGVDIQPIAIQICKLRFFISLLIEQEIDKSQENYGILPLPNLETKFVAANTLISLNRSQNYFKSPEVEQLEKKLFEYRKEIFYINTREKKLKFQQEKKKTRLELKKALTLSGFASDVASKISNWDPFDQNSSASWFDSEFMFRVLDGFDIIIGNPPYVSTKSVLASDKKILMHQYGFADDLYNHFYFKGIQLLKEKGSLIFISSKTFWTIQTKKNLRELLLQNKLLKIIDTANPFASVMVDTCIILVQKNKPSNSYEIIFIDAREGLEKKVLYTLSSQIYKTVANSVFFIPTELNLKIYEKIANRVKKLLDEWWDKISTSKNIEKHKKELETYRNSLKAGDLTLLGLITEGGQGLATANNGKYIGVLEGTKWANKVKEERPKKLWEFIEINKPKELTNLKSKTAVENYLQNLTEDEIRKLFDQLKENYGRDIFGQGWLYRIVNQNEIANVEKLKKNEKLEGIAGKKTFVPYDKGDKDGNRWWAPTPYYIDWSRENVKFLKENSGQKGEGMPVVRNPKFYFREGFCWNNVLSDEKIKCRLKDKTVHSTEAMTFISIITEKANDRYLICLLNSSFLGNYRMDFINVSHHLTTGNAKEFPIIIPTQLQLKEFERIFNQAKGIREQKFSGKMSESQVEEKLNEIQKELDQKVLQLYALE